MMAERRLNSTSLNAWREINANGLLSRLRLRVYNDIAENGPCTQRQSTVRLSGRDGAINGGNFTTRFSELERLGVIARTGITKCEYTSHDVFLWEITDSLPRAIKKPETRISMATAALKEIATYGGLQSTIAIEALRNMKAIL